MRILISACLLGVSCRYDGREKRMEHLDELLRAGHELVPVCPETLGGLPTPRAPSERMGDRVVTNDGRDVTENYHRGAREALKICRLLRCDAALLSERSPSCGCGRIYDGSFSRTLTAGNGVTAELLLQNGIPVFGQSDWFRFL